MFMTVSKLARKTAEPCTLDDVTDVIPAIPSRDAYRALIDSLITEGKIIYRSGSIDENNMLETVTLYRNQQDYDEFQLTPEWIAFSTDIFTIYNLDSMREEEI